MEKKMTFEEASAKIIDDVYAACLTFEKLEYEGLVRGNGHHMAQDIASHAQRLLHARWTGEK